MPLVALAVSIGTPVVVFGWLWLAERIVAVLPRRFRARVRATLWLLPAGVLVGVFLMWPLVYTTVLSVRNATGRGWSGLGNYRYLVTSDEVRSALRNNVLWVAALVVVPSVIGLAVAVLADRVRYESVAKVAVVAPIAISFVAGAIIWRSMFEFQPSGQPQTSTLNAALTKLPGVEPIAWLVDTRTNNAALITVGVWMAAGFATIVLSAALKGLPAELIEAAHVDGASRWQAFRYITLPQLRPALVVVGTTLAITALKAFDIVYVMTNGAFNTNVIANVLYQQLFVAQHDGRASAVAVLLSVIAVPIVYLNVRAARSGAIRR
jgi:alpha-glucoside transport system permease protein